MSKTYIHGRVKSANFNQLVLQDYPMDFDDFWCKMKLGSCLSRFCVLFPTFVQWKKTKTSREVQNSVFPRLFCKQFGKTLVHHEGDGRRASKCIIPQYMDGLPLSCLQNVFLWPQPKFQLRTPKNKIIRVILRSQNPSSQRFTSIFNSSGSGTGATQM